LQVLKRSQLYSGSNNGCVTGHANGHGPIWRRHSAVKPLRMMMSVPDDRFALETRLVVLNFMGLIPASCPASAAVSEGSRLNASIDEIEEEESGIHSTGHQGFWQSPEKDTCQADFGVLECVLCEKNSDQAVYVDQTSSDFSTDRITDTNFKFNASVPAVRLVDSTYDDMSQDQIHLHLSAMQSYLTPASSQLQPPNSVSPRSVSPSSPLAERQLSHRSSGSSTRSRLSGRHNSYVDVRFVDVESLVKTRAVTPLALPLRDELFRELDAERISEEPVGM
jgi:hypothetical protein